MPVPPVQPVPPNHRAVGAQIAPLELPAPIRAQLAAWQEAAPTHALRCARAIAAQRIAACIQYRGQHLDLWGLGLTDLPECLVQCDHPIMLSLDLNQFAQAPGVLGRLHPDSTIRGLPDFADPPPEDGAVAQLAAPGLAHMEPYLNADDPSPDWNDLGVADQRVAEDLLRLFPSRPAVPSAGAGPQASLVAALGHWADQAHACAMPHVVWTQDDRTRLHALDPDAAFGCWLSRMRDPQADTVAPRQLTQRVCRLLDAIQHDEDLARSCVAIAHDAIESCADRVILGLGRMEQALWCATARAGDLSMPAVLSMGCAMHRARLLETLAHEHAQQTGAPDPVEVQLVFEVKLRHRLRLPFAATHMNFDHFQWHRVGEQDLQAAAQQIEAAHNLSPRFHLLSLPQSDARAPWLAFLRGLSELHPVGRYLADTFTAWPARCQQDDATFADRQARLQETMYACLEELTRLSEMGVLPEQRYRVACDTARFFALHGEAYRAALVALTAHPPLTQTVPV